MEQLSQLNLLTAYHKGQNDIAKEFYLPCMSCAISYDRAVGFFNSTIYILAWHSLKSFVDRGGKMRIVCSPVLSADDIVALGEGLGVALETQTEERLRAELKRMLEDPSRRKPSRVLASLIALGVVEFRIAYIGNQVDTASRRLFHDKLGVFRDSQGNVVVFKGSMNETWAGLSSDGNLESVDVFASWEGHRDQMRITTETEYFEKVWSGKYPTVIVRDLPEIVLNDLIDASDAKNWPEMVNEICLEIDEAVAVSADRTVGGRIPRPHQLHAIQEWNTKGRRGILEHATGSGKTFTALCLIRESLERKEIPLILVPSKELLLQWHKELRETLADLAPMVLLCGSGNNSWSQDGILKAWTKVGSNIRIVLAMMQTANSNEFRSSISEGDHLFLVADEVHRLGSPENRKLLTIASGPRLGLSATPKRAGDSIGTLAIFDYFEGVVPPPFTLLDAIKAKTLTPYLYYVHTISLTTEESENWNRLTARIRKLYLSFQNNEGQDQDEFNSRIKLLLIERARIAKSAIGKIKLSLKVIEDNYKFGQRWIIYCDDLSQLTAVINELRGHEFEATEYHSAMKGDREQTLLRFEANGGILVSIRCLDEGVDIPSVTHALILASSKNPREFIQRRGRVLRQSPGKTFAFLHDALVVPEIAGDDHPEIAILESELVRAIEFGKAAENPTSITDLQRIAVRFGVDYVKLLEGGIEDD